MQVSEAESVVMEVLWAGSPKTAEDVVDALSGEQDWQEPTIKTLLNRLLKKGAISAEREGRRYLYSPVLRREDWVRAQSSSLLERLFGGRLAPLLAQFQAEQGLSAEDRAALRELLERSEAEAHARPRGSKRR
jgi:BlaI family penicillinase repressor